MSRPSWPRQTRNLLSRRSARGTALGSISRQQNTAWEEVEKSEPSPTLARDEGISPKTQSRKNRRRKVKQRSANRREKRQLRMATRRLDVASVHNINPPVAGKEAVKTHIDKNRPQGRVTRSTTAVLPPRDGVGVEFRMMVGRTVGVSPAVLLSMLVVLPSSWCLRCRTRSQASQWSPWR